MSEFTINDLSVTVTIDGDTVVVTSTHNPEHTDLVDGRLVLTFTSKTKAEALFDLLNRPVRFLGGDIRVQNGIAHLGCTKVGHVVIRTEREFGLTKNVGKKTLRRLKEILASHGLCLGMQIEELGGWTPD